MSASFTHTSARAEAVIANGGRIFEVALPRSDINVSMNMRTEFASRQACAKMCAERGMRLLDVWFEDGESDDYGKYRIWYVIVEDDVKRRARRRVA